MKTIGTLEEIGAQVGDVVTFADGTFKHTITHVNADGSYCSYISSPSDIANPSRTANDWRIITRAAKSPVRTVTRKEIVPGVYGKVVVTTEEGCYPAISVTDCIDISDLTAAIKTLTEIRDAMQDNT